MAICIEADVNGVLSLVDPQPGDTSTCPYVVTSGAEVGSVPWALTIEQAHEIGLAILLICAVAWSLRYIADFIDRNEEEKS